PAAHRRTVTTAILLSLSLLAGCTGAYKSSSTNEEWRPILPHDPVILSDTNHLTNANATKEARILHNYLRDSYGRAILSGQQESTWMGSPEYEMDYVRKTTGKLPAIRGLDYINEDFAGVTQRSIDWWEQGGIVS